MKFKYIRKEECDDVAICCMHIYCIIAIATTLKSKNSMLTGVVVCFAILVILGIAGS